MESNIQRKERGEIKTMFDRKEGADHTGVLANSLRGTKLTGSYQQIYKVRKSLVSTRKMKLPGLAWTISRKLTPTTKWRVHYQCVQNIDHLA